MINSLNIEVTSFLCEMANGVSIQHFVYHHLIVLEKYTIAIIVSLTIERVNSIIDGAPV